MTPTMIGKTISQFRILSQLGGRGVGVLCEAENLGLHRHLVLNWFEEVKQKVPTGKE
jgi:hypothetical protein